MDETQLVNRFDGKDNLRDVEPRDVLGEDLILDKHRHQVSTRQELHQHVEEVGVLEGSVELDDPGAVGLGEDVSFCPDVGELVLLEHFRLDQRLHRIDDTVRLLLHKLDLSERTLADDLDGSVVLRLVLGPQKPQVPAFLAAGILPQLLASRGGLVGVG